MQFKVSLPLGPESRYFHIRLNNKRFAAKTPRFAGKRTVSAQVSVENTREKHGKR